MRILALDTSTEACSTALSIANETRERFELGGRHAERILSMIDELLAEAGVALTSLDAIAFGRGPGLFTGLRIGAGVVQGLAYGADLPVAPISSLAALAQGQREPNVLAAFDARMHQVYWGVYRRGSHGLVEPIAAESVVSPREIEPPGDGAWIGVGSGWDQYHEELLERLAGARVSWRGEAFPRASGLIPLAKSAIEAGRVVGADQAVPVYLRDDVAAKAAER